MAIRDFLIFDDTTPVPEEAQLGSGDTARLMLDSARAMVVLTEAEADVFVIDTVAGIVTMSSVGVSGAIPTLAFYDTDCGDGDVSASIVVDATTTTTNIEEVDFSIYQQKTGTLTRTFFSDIDQGIWLYPLGESANPVSITTGGDLNIASKLTHDGDADTYLQFSADQLQLIVGGATAFNYDEGALNTLAIDQEGTADISFGGGNVFIGGSEGSYDTKVGVGTITPLRQLSISKDSDNADIGIYCYHDTEASSSRLFFNKADGSEASPTLVDDNAVLGEIISAGYDGVNFGTIGARIKFIVNGTPTTNRMPTDIEFYTAEGAGDDDIALAMTIGKTGNVTPTQHLLISAGNNVYLDGGGDTYIKQSSADIVSHFVGGVEALTIKEATNIIVGIQNASPEAWHSSFTALQLGGNASLMAGTSQVAGAQANFAQNLYYDGAWRYIATDKASRYKQVNGTHEFYVVASGSADASISGTEVNALTIANNANIGIETENLATWTSTVSALQVGGTAGLSSQTTQANSTFTLLSQNAYNDGSWKYLSTNVDDQASHIVMVDGSTQFKTAIAGSADSAVTWITQLVLANNSSGLSATFGGDIIVPQGNKVSLNAGGDTYITEFVDNQMRLTVAGTDRVKIDGDGFGGITAGEPLIRARTVATATTPVYSIVGSTGYGLGGAPASNYVSMIANSAEAMRWTETGGVITIEHFGLVADTASAGITASVTQTQGQQPLTARFNQISTVGNANDVVTLASLPASGSISQTVANDGANTLQIFPASGDDLGAGVDTSITLAPGGIFTFRSFNATTWKVV